MPWGVLALVGLAGIVVLYTPEIRSAALALWARLGPEESGDVDDSDDEAERERRELQRRFDADPGNGRIAARLILLSGDLESAERVFDAYGLAEATVGRYCPECAFATKLIEYDDQPSGLIRATKLLSEAIFEASAYQESARAFGGHPERRNDLAAYDAAFQEFYLDAGGDASLFPKE